MLKNNKGFSLLEVMIIFGIISLLIAVAVPSFSNYSKMATDKVALTEGQFVVSSAKITILNLKINDNFSQKSILERIDQILSFSQQNGIIIEISCTEDDTDLDTIIYKSSNNKYVLYEESLDKYTVYDELPNANSVIGYLNKSKTLLPEVIASQGNTNLWTKLRNAYTQSFGGIDPPISMAEKELLNCLNSNILDNLTWKPTILVDSQNPSHLMMIAPHHTNTTTHAHMILYQ